MSSDPLNAYYEQDREHERLLQGSNQLEFVRTLELMVRFLPPAPARILDIGGGTGPYSRWLLERGYSVHLLDAMPKHIERVQQDSTLARLESAVVGDARALPYAAASADAALLFGPLYHLTGRADRVTALREARRCVKAGGVVLAAVITRTASALDGLLAGMDADPRFAAMRKHTLDTGLHLPPDPALGWFTEAYFHSPAEVLAEVEDAGLTNAALYAVEGLGNIVPEFDLLWADPERRERLLDLVRRTETDPHLWGVSAHILAVGQV
ncbi:class I SAM-dependent methyltransferase [Deinococcus sp. Arct2-2]|uniref:class I SAM-dependent methyltransferase n=1 Tax=Deinococcus sp. Arct2-2 TaxID=2568653 RepID=UPI0010A3E7B8|nr:class I SAM-dependent methyltransferase [Deinococcus sp. Arct2-2]THF71173.1 class I SAM-dependent methyltransferase [Deinococcus sp. Arct2-2]